MKQAGEFLEDTIGSVESTISVIPPEGLTPFPGYLLCVCVLAAQSCPTLCNPMECSPPGSPSMEFSRSSHKGLFFFFSGCAMRLVG